MKSRDRGERERRVRVGGGKGDKKGEVGRRSARGRGVVCSYALFGRSELSPRRPTLLRSGEDHSHSRNTSPTSPHVINDNKVLSLWVDIP